MANARPVVLIMYDARLIAKQLSQKLQVALTAENILTPTAEIAQQIYYNFVRLFLNVSDHSLTTLPLSADSDHDQELHRKSISLVIVYQSMKAFIKDNSDKKLDLTMCDLVTPGKIPQRFRKLTSFLVDFMKLHQMASPIFNEISEEFSDRKLEMEAIQEELLAAKKRKNDLVSRQSLRKRREHELMNDHNKVKEELSNIVSQYMENKDYSTALDEQKDEAEQQIEAFKKEIIAGKKTVELLNEEILDSPEELRQEMAERKKQIEELKDCLKSSRENLQTMLEARDICINSEKNVPVINEKIKMWTEVRENIIDLIDIVNENRRKLKEIKEQFVFTADKKENTGERMVEQAEMHQQLRKEHLQRIQELQNNIEDITRQITAMGKNQPDISRDIEKKRQELLATKNAHSVTVAKTSNTCQDALAKFRKVDSLFRDTQRIALEKKTAGDRAMGRVRNSFIGPLRNDYTFSTSSINDSDENCDPCSPVDSEFSVFK